MKKAVSLTPGLLCAAGAASAFAAEELRAPYLGGSLSGYFYGDELEAVARAVKARDDIDPALEGRAGCLGADASNRDLSLRRVEGVKARLADYGISASCISAVGFGEKRPRADSSTEEGRARNRRVIGDLTFTAGVEP